MIERKRFGMGGCALAIGLAALATSNKAGAQVNLATEYTIILLDGSGSMLEPSSKYTANNPVSKWAESINRAKIAVEQQRDGRLLKSTDPSYDPEYATSDPPSNTQGLARTNNCYAIWRFGNTMEKIYPPAETGMTFKCADPTSEATRKLVYDEVNRTLNTLTEPSSSNQTPLAGGLCDALNAVRQAGADNAYRSVILESDGLENATPSTHACQGTSSTFNPATLNPDNNQYLAWAGGAARGSWQWRTYTVAALDGFETGRLSTDRDYLTNYPIPDAGWTAGVLGLKPQQNWLSFYKDAWGLSADEDARIFSRLVALHIDALYEFDEGLAPASAQLNIVAAAVPPTHPTDELKAFMRNISEKTGGRFQKIQYHKALSSRPGAEHTYPGDVGDNQCVDMADYNAIKQPDVFGRPSSDSQIAKRYDANRDGWVNQADLTLVLKNKGCGKCQGSSGPVVACPVGI